MIDLNMDFHTLDGKLIYIQRFNCYGENHFGIEYEMLDSPTAFEAHFDIKHGFRHTPKINAVPLNAEQGSFFTPKKIIRSGNRTIVFWEDGTKTIVKRGDDEEDSPYHAFTAAVCKKIFGSNSAIKKVLRDKVNSYVGKNDDDDYDFVFADALKLFRRKRGFVDSET